MKSPLDLENLRQIRVDLVLEGRAHAVQRAATRNHAGMYDCEDSRKQRWAIPIAIIALMLILGFTMPAFR
jgi:hypothetical protein